MKDYTGMYELTTEGSISECLGINDARVEVLAKAIAVNAVNCDRVTESMEKLWEISEHPNEFAWMMFMYGSKVGASRIMDDLKHHLKDIK